MTFRRRKDAPVWAASVMLLAAGIIVGARALAIPGDAPTTPSEAAAAGAERRAPVPTSLAPPPEHDPSAPPPGAGSDDARAVLFRARLSMAAPLQALVWRAFHPPPPRPSAPTALRLARVAPGGTPQACLAQAVYYEARGEPREGQAAVAQVVLNRTRSAGRPSSVCGVVFEGAARPGCQFSFACDRRLGGRRVEAGAWREAQQVAAAALSGEAAPTLRDAVNYHADYVRPRWAAQFQRTVEIGRHIFYAALKPVTKAWAPSASHTPGDAE